MATADASVLAGATNGQSRKEKSVQGEEQGLNEAAAAERTRDEL